MTELNQTPPTQAEVDAALDPDVLSGAHIRALKKLDEKNVDMEDLEDIFEGFLTAYEAAKAPDPAWH